MFFVDGKVSSDYNKIVVISMEQLKKIVEELEKEYDIKKQVKLLQRISGLLITDYAVKVCGTVIEPLWVEAYYFHKGKFEDFNCHKKPKQSGGFGKLYLHTEKKISPSNRLGGVDIVLSLGDYYLSFLIKNSLCGGEFCRQVELNAMLSQREYSFENSDNVLVKLKRNHYVFFTKRIGMTKESFRDENIAVLPIDLLKKYPFRFKERIAFEYMEEYRKNHSESECMKECKSILGYMPKKISYLP